MPGRTEVKWTREADQKTKELWTLESSSAIYEQSYHKQVSTLLNFNFLTYQMLNLPTKVIMSIMAYNKTV